MFSKYDEISKLIRNYIEASLVKPMMDVTMLNKHLLERYGISLTNIDATNLTNKISAVKKLRSEFALKNQNSFKQDESVLAELKQQEALVVEEEGKVREFGYALANKICIMIYKGPLTIDTMKELKEHKYDGTYGNITMMQMYALYNKKQRLEDENEKLKSDNAKKDALVDAFRQQYTKQYHDLEGYKIKNDGLLNENANLRESQQQLRQCIVDQSAALQVLNQNIVSFMQSYLGNNVMTPIDRKNETVELQKAA